MCLADYWRLNANPQNQENTKFWNAQYKTLLKIHPMEMVKMVPGESLGVS